MCRAVFLDRDGVINAAIYNSVEDKLDSPYSLDEFRVLPGVAMGVRMINDLGFQVLVASNQPGLAKGKCSAEFLEELRDRLAASLAEERARLDGIYYCLHHPEAVVPSLRGVCECRKPRPGLLLKAASERDIDLANSFMIGDQPTDIEAGAAAGCRTVLLNGHATTSRPETLIASPDHVAVDLLAAAGIIQSLEGEN